MANSTKVKDKSEMMIRLIVASSIERMLDYIMNIGELTINLGHAMGETCSSLDGIVKTPSMDEPFA